MRVKYVQRYSKKTWRDNTYTIVIEGCLERDIGEDLEICSTDTK